MLADLDQVNKFAPPMWEKTLDVLNSPRKQALLIMFGAVVFSRKIARTRADTRLDAKARQQIAQGVAPMLFQVVSFIRRYGKVTRCIDPIMTTVLSGGCYELLKGR